MRIIRVCLLVAISLAPLPAEEIFFDNFGALPPGWLSFPVGELNGAIQEYHYLPHRGVDARPWYNPIVYLDSWVAGDEQGEPYLEQHLINSLPGLMNPLFVTGDARDEIILWDQQQVWIYTQDRPFEGSRIYAPRRNPMYNDSNYRATVSLPGWKDARP